MMGTNQSLIITNYINNIVMHSEQFIMICNYIYLQK